MNRLFAAVCMISVFGAAEAQESITNRLIDYPSFRRLVDEGSVEREAHRLTEDAFLAVMKVPGVVILDARSESKYHLRHIRGAVSLPFTDFTATALANVIPSKASKILIYCNNNFLGSPVSFASKAPAASLNLSTYSSLKAYGYTNIFELGPLLEISKTRIPFAGTELNK